MECELTPQEKIDYSIKALKTLKKIFNDNSIFLEEYIFKGKAYPVSLSLGTVDSIPTQRILVTFHATLSIEIESLSPPNITQKEKHDKF